MLFILFFGLVPQEHAMNLWLLPVVNLKQWLADHISAFSVF